VIQQLLPASIMVVETFEDMTGEAVFPGEEDFVAHAVESRRREFVTTRRCAREALAKLGYAPAAIRCGPKREPLWPAGVVGSMTHTNGFRAAAVAHRSVLASIGVDAEPNEPLPEGVEDTVITTSEQDMLVPLRRNLPGVDWGRLLFSAKEAIYKAWYPLTGRWLGFDDAHVTIDPKGTFSAKLLIDGARTDGGPALTDISGRFVAHRGLVATAVTVPHEQRT
jgi:4'-phosphopantetheinyl transferase EntD